MWIVKHGFLLSLVFAFLLFFTELSMPVVIAIYVAILLAVSLVKRIVGQRGNKSGGAE